MNSKDSYSETMDIDNTTFAYHRLRVRFFAHKDLTLKGWIGAVLRNNFLVQAASVADGKGKTLFDQLNTLPLAETHPAWKALQGGFPKAIWFDCRDMSVNNRNHCLKANQIYSFTLVVAHRFIANLPFITEALYRMFSKGFGHPVVSTTLIDLCAYDLSGQWQLCYQPEIGLIRMPDNPVGISDFQLAPDSPSEISIRIDFETPVNLFRPRTKKDTELSFQDKLNGFPSFYQFMRSLVYRVQTLELLYGDQTGTRGWQTSEIDSFLQKACSAQLQEVNLKNQKVHGTPKQGSNHVYVLEGYQGYQIWRQVPSTYLPLMAFGMGLLVGNQVQYSLGAYTITIL